MAVGCHGNDATGGAGCYDSRQIGVDGREAPWFLLLTDPAARLQMALYLSVCVCVKWPRSKPVF